MGDRHKVMKGIIHHSVVVEPSIRLGLLIIYLFTLSKDVIDPNLGPNIQTLPLHHATALL